MAGLEGISPGTFAHTMRRFREHKIFPGKLIPKTLPLAQRASLLVFRGLAGDFRDWTEVRQWATASPASSPP